MKTFMYIILSILAAAVALVLAVAITSIVNNVTFVSTLEGWFDAVLGFFGGLTK